MEKNNYIFPFDCITKNSNIVLYGAGFVGKIYYRQITKLNYCNIVVWVDKNAENLSKHYKVSLITEIRNVEFDYIVIAIADKTVCEKIEDELMAVYGLQKERIVY